MLTDEQELESMRKKMSTPDIADAIAKCQQAIQRALKHGDPVEPLERQLRLLNVVLDERR